MDKRETIEFLKKSLGEIPHLAKLPYNNDDYPLWHSTIEGILENVFGRDSSEYRKFFEAYSHVSYLGENRQKTYLWELKRRETVLLSIIQIHETLGIETEPPKAAKDYGGRMVDKEFELTVQGTPDMILECIRSTVETLNSQGYKYGFRRTSGRPDYTNWDKTYFASYAISQGTEGQIGAIKLQLIADDKTILKTSQPDEWNSSYSIFLDSLFAEFQQLEDVKEEKPATTAELPPKAFIAHGGDSPALRKLKQFLEALGVEPLVVEEQPSEGRSVAENVDWYARQADCAIILATKGDVDARTGGFIPRGNVLMETGKLQEIFKDRIIYLLQAGTKFPTNINEKVRERFTSQNMDNAFIKIAKELKKFGILRAVKP